MSPPIWLRADEQREAVRALEMFRTQVDRALEDPLSWKWALVALHNAVQNFIIASMNGPAVLGTLKPFIAEKWLQSSSTGNDETVRSIPDYFLELYGRMKDETGYQPSLEVDIAIGRLNEHRNAFIHYTPASWLLHVNELPGIALECLSVIRALGWKPGCILWQDESLREAAEREHDACRARIEELEVRYRV